MRVRAAIAASITSLSEASSNCRAYWRRLNPTRIGVPGYFFMLYQEIHLFEVSVMKPMKSVFFSQNAVGNLNQYLSVRPVAIRLIEASFAAGRSGLKFTSPRCRIACGK